MVGFTVKFKVPFKGAKHIIGTTGEWGLNLVKEVREKIGKKVHVDKLRINSSCPIGNTSTISIHVTDETMISKIPWFEYMNDVNVIVPEGFIGQYHYLHVKTFMGSDFEEFLRRLFHRPASYHVSYKVDNKSILNDWIKDGCPKFWNIREEDVVADNNQYNMYVIKIRDQFNQISDYKCTGISVPDAMHSFNDIHHRHDEEGRQEIIGQIVEVYIATEDTETEKKE